MILGLGIPELLIILIVILVIFGPKNIVILVIFGPKNLPKIGSALGKTVKNVREGMEEGKEDKSESPVEAHDDAVEVIEDDDDADAPEAKFCPKCGTQNAADAGFCSKCGSKLD